MKLITRYTDYSIRALLYMAKKRDSVTVSELVEALGIPRAFLRMILQILSKKRILRSHKGRGGGFYLAVAPSSITLLTLIEVFQGRLRLNECTFKKAICPNIKTCRVKKEIDSIQRYVISRLKGVTLQSLIKRGQS